MYLIETGSITELPSFYEDTRLVARDRPKTGKGYPKLVLDIAEFTLRLEQFNPGADLLLEEIFLVWHHLITVEY